MPSPIEQHVQPTINLNDEFMINPSASYLFRVSGDSMKNIGIFSGDTIMVDRSLEPQHNCIVLAVVDQEFTVKRLYMRGDLVELRPENESFQPIVLAEGQELTIWGVVTMSIRKVIGI